MCLGKCVPACVWFGVLEGKGRLGKGTELSPLCCFVVSCNAQWESTTKRVEPKLFVCPSLLPTHPLPPLVHSLTYRTLLNGLKWPQGWTEPQMFVQQGTRKSPRKKDVVRTTWVSPLLCVLLSSLSSSLADGHNLAQPMTKMSTVYVKERSQCLNNSLTV